MHLDARNIEQGSILKSEICVAGAGAAGITIAHRLADTSTDVLLLESGGMDSPGQAQELYEGKIAGFPQHSSLDSCRLRFFGGSTNHWAGWCSPLDPIDFKKRSWVPYSGWPISRKDLDPYYREAQQICQLGRYDYDPESWEHIFPKGTRIPFNSNRFRDRVIHLSPPTRFGQEYRDDIVNAPNITFVTHANVTQINTPPSVSTVSNLQAECLDGNTFSIESERYVIACGGIENARLLLLSDSHAPNGLGNQNDLVGRFYMVHPSVPSSTILFKEPMSLSPYRGGRFRSSKKKVVFKPKLRSEKQKDEELLNGYFTLDFESSGYVSARNTFQKLRTEKFRFGEDIGELSDAISNILRDFEGAAAGVNEALQGDSPWNAGFEVLSVETNMEQAPNPQSRVLLGEERDALNQRRVKLDWKLTDLEKHSIRRQNRLLARELGSLGIGRLRLHDWMRNNDEFSWPSNLKAGIHHMGTTRMGSTPLDSVCNSQCRVHGLSNLYMAGSSVFPTGGSVPPTLTIVALSLRLAEHLKDFSKK